MVELPGNQEYTCTSWVGSVYPCIINDGFTKFKDIFTAQMLW